MRTGIVTHAHSRRSSRLEDEVVDRADEQDVGAEEARCRPPIGGSASDGSWVAALHDLAVVADDRPAVRAGREQAPPQAFADVRVGDPPRSGRSR